MEEYYHEVTPNITDPRLAPEVRVAPPTHPPAVPQQTTMGGLFTSVTDTKFIVLFIVIAIIVIIIIAYVVKTYAISDGSSNATAPAQTPPVPTQAPIQAPTQVPTQTQQAPTQPAPTQSAPVQTQQQQSIPSRDEIMAMYKRTKVDTTGAAQSETIAEVPDGAKSDEEISQLMESAEESPEETTENQTCTEITSSGKQCKKRAKVNGKCHVHSV